MLVKTLEETSEKSSRKAVEETIPDSGSIEPATGAGIWSDLQHPAGHHL
jgi:hypothetical protein